MSAFINDEVYEKKDLEKKNINWLIKLNQIRGGGGTAVLAVLVVVGDPQHLIIISSAS